MREKRGERGGKVTVGLNLAEMSRSPQGSRKGEDVLDRRGGMCEDIVGILGGGGRLQMQR